MYNGVYQWRDASSIKCFNPVDAMTHIGTKNCNWILKENKWGYKAAYVNLDTPEFRTLGKVVPE